MIRASTIPRYALLGFLAALGAPDAESRASSGESAARLRLHELDGRLRSLEEYRGRVVILNFWATWCLPCREEMPVLAGVKRSYGERGVEVIAASVDAEKDRGIVETFARRHRLNFPVWVGASVESMEELGLGRELPATAILDAEGRIAFRIRGPVSGPLLAERLDRLLGEAGAAPRADVDTFPAEAAGAAHAHEHDHGEGAEHEHGGVGMEGASLVPS